MIAISEHNLYTFKNFYIILRFFNIICIINLYRHKNKIQVVDERNQNGHVVARERKSYWNFVPTNVLFYVIMRVKMIFLLVEWKVTVQGDFFRKQSVTIFIKKLKIQKNSNSISRTPRGHLSCTKNINWSTFYRLSFKRKKSEKRPTRDVIL